MTLRREPHCQLSKYYSRLNQPKFPLPSLKAIRLPELQAVSSQDLMGMSLMQPLFQPNRPPLIEEIYLLPQSHYAYPVQELIAATARVKKMDKQWGDPRRTKIK